MTVRILAGDVFEKLAELPDDSVHMVCTSPPYYGLRDYGTGLWQGGDPNCRHAATELRRGVNLAQSHVSHRGGSKKIARVGWLPYRHTCGKCGAERRDLQIGLEDSYIEYLETMVEVFGEIRRVLRPDGVVWLNIGDSYATKPFYDGDTIDPKWPQARNRGRYSGPNRRPQPGIKPKDLMLIPQRLVIALQEDGWWIRRDVIWHKLNPMPESTEDRPTTAHEYLWLLAKSEHYFYDNFAVMEQAQPDTIKRAQRGRSDAHKWADGGPGDQTIARASPSPGRLLPGLPVPAGWNTEPGRHDEVPIGRRRQRGLTPRHLPHTTSCDQSGLDEVGRGSGANKRSVWPVATAPFDGEFCKACQRYFTGPEYRELRTETKVDEHGREIVLRFCTCGSSSSRLSHFATFPPDLIIPCIEAGTSERGCCAKCGAPWRRIVETAYVQSAKHGEGSKSMTRPRHDGREDDSGDRPHVTKMAVTKGWEPGCECHDGLAPCIVLDPFGGAGTTALVCERLGRNSILIELNPDYIEMARQRISRDAVLFAEVVTA